MTRILVTGPTRSGKSRLAENLANDTLRPVIYIATSPRFSEDPEWEARIRLHQQRRSSSWLTMEITHDLSTVIAAASPHQCLLIDSLGSWVANWIEADNRAWEVQVEALLENLKGSEATIIMVAEEVGWGVVPAYALGRMFRDRLGELSQQVGMVCNHLYLAIAGYAFDLKQVGQQIR